MSNSLPAVPLHRALGDWCIFRCIYDNVFWHDSCLEETSLRVFTSSFKQCRRFYRISTNFLNSPVNNRPSIETIPRKFVSFFLLTNILSTVFPLEPILLDERCKLREIDFIKILYFNWGIVFFGEEILEILLIIWIFLPISFQRLSPVITDFFTILVDGDLLSLVD